jgi:hypothetical protein
MKLRLTEASTSVASFPRQILKYLLLVLVAVLLGGFNSGTRAAEVRTAAATLGSASNSARQEFSRRVADALARNRDVKVVYQDVLGEGPGSWDSDPRYPTDKVNCITWLQLILAEAYGSTSEEKLAVLDRLRYFGGRVGFGFRKHFIDQWTKLDPLPLSEIDFRSCPSADVKSYRLELNTKLFQKKIKFNCPLYHMDRTAIELNLVPPHGLVQCGDRLTEGYYVIFPVAGDRYLKKYGGFSGPMGQVHAVLLEVPPPAALGAPPEARDPGKFKVYHAAVSRGQVLETDLASYMLHMWNFYRGYVVYELMPDWDWSAQGFTDEEARAVSNCESKLKGHVGKIFENEIEVAPDSQP